MIKEIVQDAGVRMSKSIDTLKQSLSKVRTGRAHPSLLDHLRVDYYGSEVPISQVANIGVEDGRTLIVTPWEKHMVQAVERAILTSDLGLNPNTAGTVMRIPMPALTEETRRDLVKVVRHEGEAADIADCDLGRLPFIAHHLDQVTAGFLGQCRHGNAHHGTGRVRVQPQV